MTAQHFNDLTHFALDDVAKVTFYKRDDLTTDLICCDIVAGGRVWTFHEDQPGWNALIQHLEALPGFRRDWFEAISQPPFAACEFVAFNRWVGV